MNPPKSLLSLLATLGIALIGPQSSLAQTGRPLRLTGGFVIDPASRTMEKRDVCVLQESVADCGSTQGEAIDVSGKFLLPGLIDAHVHAFGNPSPDPSVNGFLGYERSASLNAKAGVTAILDLFAAEDLVFGARDRIRKGETAPSAELFAAGPCLTAPGGHCTEYGLATRTIASPAEATDTILSLSTRHPDVIKVVYDHEAPMPTITRDTLQAAVETAARLNIPSVVHVGTWQDARDAIEAGASAVTHLPMGEMPAGVAVKARQKGTLWIPTLAVQQEYLNIHNDPSLLNAPFLQRFAWPELLRSYRRAEATRANQTFLRWQEQHVQSDLINLKQLANAGVALATGTDSGNLGLFQGYSLHRELEIFQRSGLSPWQILNAATTIPANFLGTQRCLQRGCPADIVVLNASPLQDVRNTKSISMVLVRGRRVNLAP